MQNITVTHVPHRRRLTTTIKSALDEFANHHKELYFPFIFFLVLLAGGIITALTSGPWEENAFFEQYRLAYIAIGMILALMHCLFFYFFGTVNKVSKSLTALMMAWVCLLYFWLFFLAARLTDLALYHL